MKHIISVLRARGIFAFQHHTIITFLKDPRVFPMFCLKNSEKYSIFLSFVAKMFKCII